MGFDEFNRSPDEPICKGAWGKALPKAGTGMGRGRTLTSVYQQVKAQHLRVTSGSLISAIIVVRLRTAREPKSYQWNRWKRLMYRDSLLKAG